MVAHITTATVVGLEAEIVDVEADVSNGLPATVIVGLPDTAVQESKERVRSALKNSSCKYPPTRVSVNLAPADTAKAGTQFDVPIALAILKASEQVDFDASSRWFVGELSLDGSLRPVPGVLAIALRAREAGVAEIFVPAENASEAALVAGLKVYACPNLSALLLHLLAGQLLLPQPATEIQPQTLSRQKALDMAEIAGQETAKRALEIAASGGHNLLMSGPPGSGKTLLARALSGILPVLTITECLELTKIYSIAGQLPHAGFVSSRPVRSPHHTTSSAALVGGGTVPRPGEITLAHRGVLFLDELPEFPRGVLEALRQPLEDGIVTVSRARSTFTFPAKFMLVSALNPCPCGYFGDSSRKCVCAPGQVQKYQKKLSGPLLDRIDLHIDVPRLTYEKMSDSTRAESTETIRVRVAAARERQYQRFGKTKTNCEMTVVDIRQYCQLGESESALLAAASERYQLSGRSIHRLLKLARTIADVAASEQIEQQHLAEALQYRPKTD